jgi:plastocyanin
MMTPMTRVGGALVVTVLCAAGITACGDDGNDGYVAPGAAIVREVPSTTSPPTPAPTTSLATEPSAGAESEPVPFVIEPTGVEVRVIAIDNIYRPETIEVAVGDDVVWENRGMNEHNILSIEGPAPGSPVGESASIGWIRGADDALSWGVTTADFQPGDTFTYRFSEPGEYHYYCAIHGTATVGMVGTVVVTR